MLLRRCPPERFFMDRKIPLNIFLIIGQSNAYGTYDVPEGRDEWDFRREQMKDAVLPEPGTVFCLTLTTSEAWAIYTTSPQADRAFPRLSGKGGMSLPEKERSCSRPPSEALR